MQAKHEPMRCFLACDVPPTLRRSISQLITELTPRFPQHAVRWVKPSDAHLTLHFLGNEVTAAMVERIREAAQQIPADFPTLHLQPTTVGYLPARGDARVISLGCGGPDESSLRRLHKCLRQMLAGIALPLDHRPWQPHITLGRIRYGGHRPNLDPTVPTKPFTALEVVLYLSTLTPDGPTYEPLGKFPLAGKHVL